MSYTSMAIIGTAGRKEDKSILSHLHYDRMVSACVTFIQKVRIDHSTVKMTSGGAAWADHLVVTLGLLGIIDPKNVTLFLPSALEHNGYVGDTQLGQKTANTANWYHSLFSKVTGKNSIDELLQLRNLGATFIDGNGSFHARNSSVAKFVSPDGVLLACTTGSPDSPQPEWTIRPCGRSSALESGLKDGGTADTFDKTLAFKYHMRIGVVV